MTYCGNEVRRRHTHYVGDAVLYRFRIGHLERVAHAHRDVHAARLERGDEQRQHLLHVELVSESLVYKLRMRCARLMEVVFLIGAVHVHLHRMQRDLFGH